MENKEGTIAPGRWTARLQLDIIRFLDGLSVDLRSRKLEEIAASLRIAATGRYPIVPSCGTCADIPSKYSVLCTRCSRDMGTLTPQKLIFRLTGVLDDPEAILWAACVYSIVFVPKMSGRPNTLAACEELLDGINNEDDAEDMVKLITSEGGNGDVGQ